jgi:hypothetical protein
MRTVFGVAVHGDEPLVSGEMAEPSRTTLSPGYGSQVTGALDVPLVRSVTFVR